MYYFIEPMVEEDIGQVQEIERQSFSTPWSTSTYRRELRHSASSRYIIARTSTTPPPPRHSRQAVPRRNLLTLFLQPLLPIAPPPNPYPIIGYGGLWLTGSEAHVTTIAVGRNQRGKGVGELLLNGLIDHALELRATWLSLEVRVSNTTAQSLYLKYGFHLTDTRRGYYTDNGEDALMMWTDPIQSPEYQAHLADLRQRLFARLRAQAEQNDRETHSVSAGMRVSG